MKVELDTINRTIKVLDECTLEEFLEFVLGLDSDIDYKLLPNTIINTIKIGGNEPLKWINPNPWKTGTPIYDPSRVTCYNQNYSTNTAILDSIHLQKSQIES